METLYHLILSQVTKKNQRYQKRYDFMYNVTLACLWTMAFYNIILPLTTVPHNCEIPDTPKNVSSEKWKEKWIPKDHAEGNKTIFSKCLVFTNGTKITECNNYQYDKTWYKSTITSDNNWVCKKEYYVINILSNNKISETIGSLVLGWFGDAYGRRLTYILSLFLLTLGRAISILFSNSYTLFAIGCLMAAFPATSVLQSTTLISMEISSPERRSTIAKWRFIASSIGMCIMPLLYWAIQDWKLFMIVTTSTQLPYLLWSWKMIESPQWLWINKRNTECKEILHKIAKYNSCSFDNHTNELMIETQEEEKNLKTQRVGFFLLFSNKKLSLITILQLCIWVSVTISYTMSLLSSGESFQANPFLEFAFQSLAEIPAHLTGAWLADHVGRRYTGVISFGVSAVAWVIIGFKDFSLFPDLEWIWTFIRVLNRYFITISYYIINLLNMEIYPTSMRQSGMAMGDLFSGLAGAVAPYILLLDHKYGSFWSSIIVSLSSIMGMLSAIALPETKAAIN